MTLDGALIEKKDLKKLMEEAKKQGNRIKEVSPGVYKTLILMND